MASRAATTFAVPPAVWETDAMLDALAARDIAQVFRFIQRETRVSQTHLGVATGLSQAQVSEIISGTRRVSSVDVLTRIATGLCMPTDARVALLLGDRTHGVATSPAPPSDPPSPTVAEEALTDRFSDVEAIYPNRSEFTSRMPPHALFDCATDIRAAGLSLNLICQQYADTRLAELVENGARLQLLFLDPAGTAIRQREIEEGLTAGHLGALTTLNLQAILRVRDRLPAEARDRISVATYDQTIRFNITLVNHELCIAQPYLPHARGVEAPTMVIKKRWPSTGLYPVFERTFEELWNGGQLR
jgi:transcriptional regulator with XRE-family HTH domain